MMTNPWGMQQPLLHWLCLQGRETAHSPTFAPISSQNFPKLPLEKAGKNGKNGVKSGNLTKRKGLQINP
jgi:hypothetical protein